MDKSKKAYKNGKKNAIDAIITSRARHLADNEYKNNSNTIGDREKYKFIAKKLSDEKVEELANMVLNADESDDQISVDIRDDKGNTKSITGDFKDDGHMSLHVIKGQNKILDKNRKGRMQSTGYGENNKFIKDNTEKDVKDLANKKFESEKKKVGLKEELILESEFSDDIKAIYGDMLDITNRHVYSEFKDKYFYDILEEINDIVYGFIDKNGRRIDDREWIHSCDDLDNYYETNFDPEITLKNKLGICLDQSIAIKYLFNKLHPECACDIYALYKGKYGHAVPCFYEPESEKYYYIENAWDKEKGIHGGFNSLSELENYLKFIYWKNHKDDNDDEVYIMTYNSDKTLTESFLDYMKDQRTEILFENLEI